MRSGFRQSMNWLHTWTGLSLGWILYFVFLTGTLGYFDSEIDAWMKPELPVETASAEDAARAGQAYLTDKAPKAKRWFMALPVNRNTPHLRLFWEEYPEGEQARGKTGSAFIDVGTGEELSGRATGGGQALYRMHYALHYLPRTTAYYIVGVCTLFMLLAIITGIVVHKKIFKDFFTFRRNKGPRSWLDIHNLLSVMALPFHIMITYSGLVFFLFTYMPLVVAGSYGFGDDNRQRFFDELYGAGATAELSGERQSVQDLSALVTDARSRLGNEVAYVNVYSPTDSSGEVHLSAASHSPLRDGPELIYSSASGEFIRREGAGDQVPKAIYDTLLGLHEGLFAGTGLRWLYFISGLLGTAMIGSGLILWSVKRGPSQLKNPSFGFRLVESLNVGTVVGVPIAIGAYFLANRLLPVGMEGRAAWEIHVMFITLAAAMLYPLARPIRRCWFELLTLAAVVFAALPIVNALTTERGFLTSALAADWVFIGVDGLCLTLAAVAVYARRYLSSRLGEPVRAGSTLNLSAQES